MKRLPIRIRVTLAFAAVMAVVLGAVGLFLYLRLAAQLDDSIDQGLRSRATEVAALARDSDSGLSRAAGHPLIERDEGFAQILEENGAVVDSSPQVHEPALDAAAIERASAGAAFFNRDELPGVEGPLRLLAVPVGSPDGSEIVVVGSSLGDRNEAVDGLARLLLIGGPIALLLASLAGYAMTAAALRPVDAMRRRAGEISASEPGARLPVPEARDELSRLGETLNEMLARLEDALERERRFVDDASHELRTPLALHRVELELALLHASGEGELREAISSATDEIDRLIALAEDLLVVARSENGQVSLVLEPFAVEDVLAAIVERFRGRAERDGRRITYDPPIEGGVIEGDRARVEQALTNLVDNAIRHGAGPVHLWARRRDERIELHVADEGPGIPDDFLEHAFERFSRADPGRGRGGAGLGLAIVDSIARAHGGAARARNRPEGGADVWVELPLVAER